MPDLGPLVGGLAELLGPLLKSALGAFVRTVAGMICAGVLVAIVAFAIAYDGAVLRGVLAVLVVLLATAVVGGVLAVKRAVGGAIITGVERAHAGSQLSGLVFTRLLSVSSGGAIGDRGTALARAVERVPLASAEARLTQVVEELIRSNPEQRGLRAALARRIQRGLLVRIQALTLARFRDHAARQGGIDLERVRDEVAAMVDGYLAKTVRLALNKVTLAILGALAVGTLLVSYGIRQLHL